MEPEAEEATMADRPRGVASGRAQSAAPCQDEAGIAPLQTLQRWLPSSAESRRRGRARRRCTPRNRLASWHAAKDRPDPVALVEAVNATRDSELVPVRNARMAESPLAF